LCLSGSYSRLLQGQKLPPACVFSASASRVRGLKADRLLSAKIAHSASHPSRAFKRSGRHLYGGFSGLRLDDRVGGKSL
jgi:hypothetical protein